MQIEERIKKFVDNYFEGSDGFLVDIKKGRGDKIQVFIDRMEKNIEIATCAELSRKLEHILEEEGWVGEKYTLEVSSPGMTNPFKVEQQYLKAIGKNVEVLFSDGIRTEGVLKSIKDDIIVVDEYHKEKGKAPVITPRKIQLNEVKSVKKKINF